MAQHFDGKRFDNVIVVSRKIEPVGYDEAATAIKRLLRKTHPCAALAFGVAKTRRLRLERYAHNLRDSAAADAAGKTIRDGRRIDPDEPDALRTMLPLHELRAALADRGFSVEISNDAGGYVCNDVFFTLLQWQQRSRRPAAFVHVPSMELPGGRHRTDVSWERLLAATEALLKGVAGFLDNAQGEAR